MSKPIHYFGTEGLNSLHKHYDSAFGGLYELKSKFEGDIVNLFGSPSHPESTNHFLYDSKTMTGGVSMTPKCKRKLALIPIVGVERLRKHTNSTRK